MSSLQSGEGQQPPLEAVATDASTAKAKGRLVKTPLQKEVLEASFNLDANPTQQHRKALAERLQLTEEQVQAWFVARRRKDKKKAGDGAPGLSEAAAGADAGGGGGASDAGAADEAGASGSTADAAQAELLELAKSALHVPFREDGPPLAIIFDTVPGPNTKKGMQAAALIAARKRKLADAAAGGGGSANEAGVAPEPAGAAAASEGQPPAAKRPKIEGTVLESMAVDAQQRVLLEEALQQQAALHASSTQKPKAAQQASSAGAGGREAMKADRLKAAAEARQAKELAKARAAQEREAKKREAATERERKAEEKRKAAEEKRREKEMARAMMQQERTTRGASHHHGPPDDLDLEYEALLVRARATAAAQAAARGLDASAVEPVVPPRPEFPPPYLLLQPAFPPEFSEELGPQLIEAWGYVTGFADLLGMPAVSMEALLSALMQGSSSPLLGLVHVLLLRQAQADMEISHATGCLQDPHPADRALVAAATRLEEAWAWGLDPDLWRAHLGPRTWPEVLRQQAIAGGAGGSRVHLKRLAAAAAAGDGAPGAEGGAAASTKSGKGRGPKGAMGYEGEDVVSGWTGDGPLKLLLPVRFGDSTWMAAAWKVLSEAGAEGLPVAEVVRRITERGYRNMAGSKNPEASVTGALSRDVLFTRLGPATYALASIVTYTQRMQAAGKPAVIEPPLHQQAAAGATGAVADQDSDDEDSDDEDEVVAAAPEDPPDAAPWVTALKHGPYDSLALDQRLAALLWLCGIVGDGLGVRNLLESREKEVAALKKQILEDTRAEKKRRQDEAAARARAASQEAQRRLEQLQRQAAAGEAVPAEAMAAAAAAAATLSAAAGLPPPGPSAASAASRAATPTPPAGPGAAGLPPTAPSAPTSPSPGAAATAAAAEGSTPPADQQRQKTPPADAAAAGAAGAGAPSGSAQPGGATGQQAEGAGHAAAGAPAAAGQTPEQLQQQKQAEAEAAAESARRAARAEAIRRLEELNALRLEPLGLDRRFNRYWLLCCPDFSITSCYTGEADDLADNTGSIPGMPPDANAGRIWVESADSGRWRLLLRPQQLDQLKQVLEPRGAREGGLHSSLLRVEGAVRAAMPGRPFQMPTRLDELPPEKQQAAAEAHLRWLQRQPLLARLFTSQQQEDAIRALTQLPAAAAAADAEPNGAEVEMQLVAADSSSTTADPDVITLKRDMLRVEALVADALQAAAGGFQHDEWVQAVSSAPDLLALRSCLAQLEAALVSSNSQAVAGSKGPGRQLLNPDWARVIAATPAVKGAWLQCGAEVAAAVLDSEGLLTPNMTGTAAATAAAAAGAADEGTDPAAAAAAPVALQSEQQLEQQQQRAQQRASLAWLPATVPSLSLRLAALDASVCYPQLQQDLGCVAGRPITAAYHYIVKPCSIFDPPTLDQLLLQEKEAAAAAKDKQQQQQQQQPTASGSASATPAADEQDGSPQSQSKQQQQQQQEQQEEVEGQEPEKLKQPAAASDILALVHPTPKPKQQQQQQQQKQLQAARKQQRTKPRQNVPTLEGVLERPLRVAYGYSLQGRGLLQLIRGLPPFPDWLQKAQLDEFKLPVSSMRAAVKAAQEDGTIHLTLEQIRDAAAAKERAKAEAAAAEAAAAAAAAAGSEEGEWGHDEAAGHHQHGGKPAAGRGKPPAKAPGKGGLKLKLNMGKAGKAAAAAGGDGPGSKAAPAAAAGKQKGEGAAAGGQPKLKLKFKSRESSPTPGAAPAKAGGKGPGSGGRLRLKQTAQLHQDQAGGDMSRKERMMRQLGLRTLTEAELAEEVQQLQDYSDDDD